MIFRGFWQSRVQQKSAWTRTVLQKCPRDPPDLCGKARIDLTSGSWVPRAGSAGSFRLMHETDGFSNSWL